MLCKKLIQQAMKNCANKKINQKKKVLLQIANAAQNLAIRAQVMMLRTEKYRRKRKALESALLKVSVNTIPPWQR